jgi:chitinase
MAQLRSAPQPTPASLDIIAYYNGDGRNITHYPVNKLTHIVFSFCHLKNGRFSVDDARDSSAIRRLVRLKTRYPALKILLSLGGWGGCQSCSSVFATDEGRAAFTQSVIEVTDYFHTDGIDIDWEYPALAGYPGQTYLPEDRDHFTALLQGLRLGLDASKEVSFSAASFSPYLESSIDWKKVMSIATRVDLMTYDIVGSGSPVTGHHASLYSSSRQTGSADHAVRYLDSLGIPMSKVVIGVAFYAREFDGVSDVNHGLYQPGTFNQFIPFKQVRKRYNAAGGYISYWDSEAGAPYSYNAARHIYLTYDNERSAALKTAYVKKKHLGGILFWELELDRARGGLTDTIYKELR